MKIAIHDDPGSFSDRWIIYCKENKVDYKIVDCYATDIIEQLDNCAGLMWHWRQEDYKAVLFARQLTLSLEKKGIKVFPGVNTSWHFDDKIGQKYLLEAINAPLVNSYVFYSEKDAMAWVHKTTFPKVFKLRGGAGSINVSLVKTREKAEKLVKRSFKRGFSSTNSVSRFKDRFWVFRRDKNFAALKGIFKGFGRLFISTKFEHFSHNQKGYIYFQDFIPGNDYDTRLIVIGDRCIGVRRYCRDGDFRASGSGVKEASLGPSKSSARPAARCAPTGEKISRPWKVDEGLESLKYFASFNSTAESRPSALTVAENIPLSGPTR